MKRPHGASIAHWILTIRRQLLSDMSMNRDWIIMDGENALAFTAILRDLARDVAELEIRTVDLPPPDLGTNVVPFVPVRRLTVKRPGGGGDAA